MKTLSCADSGSKYCPCHLAYSNDCIRCNMLNKNKTCDCMWQGVCIYNEVKHNKNSPVVQRSEYLCDIESMKVVEDNTYLIRIKIPKELSKDLRSPGAYVLIKRKDKESDIFSAPISVMDVDLDKNIIIGGMKTDSGTDRIVPIHPKIKELAARRYTEAKELGSEYLLNTTDGTKKKDRLKLTYDKYKHRFEKIIKEYGMDPNHRAHDGRKQFITMCKKYNVDEYALKYIVGHKITDITERVYTDRDIEWLKEEISKVK